MPVPNVLRQPTATTPKKKYMENTEELNNEQLKRICVVILKNDFACSFVQIAEVLNITTTEAKELYMQLIRRLENHELAEKTQITN